jgi:hypothetical protein
MTTTTYTAPLSLPTLSPARLAALLRGLGAEVTRPDGPVRFTWRDTYYDAAVGQGPNGIPLVRIRLGFHVAGGPVASPFDVLRALDEWNDSSPVVRAGLEAWRPDRVSVALTWTHVFIADPGDGPLAGLVGTILEAEREGWHDLDQRVRRPVSLRQPTDDAPLFRLDEEFLESVGLAGLPERPATRLLQRIYRELEMRVGEKLTENMDDDLLDEFGHFVDGDLDAMLAWLQDHVPAFMEDPALAALHEANPEASMEVLLSEYGARQWLKLNRPEYPEVVAAVLDDLKLDLSMEVALHSTAIAEDPAGFDYESLIPAAD